MIRLPAIIALALLFLPTASWAQESGHPAPKAEAAAEQPPVPAPALKPDIPDDYCANIADKARDARYLLQARTLEDLQKKLEAETAKLEQKRAELAAVVKKRDDALSLARRELVDIYAKMKPDAAAIQLSLLDPETAASVMRQLKPAGASLILTEMKPDVAAAIAAILAVPPDTDTAKEQGT